MPLRALISRDYLSNLLDAGAFDEGTVDSLTNEQLFHWLTPSGPKGDLELVPLVEMEQWFSACRWTYGEKFAFAVDKLLFDVVKQLLDHAARAMLRTDRRHNGVITLVVKLIPNLQLRVNVETLLEANLNNCRKSWPSFCKVLRHEALQLDAVRTANRLLKV